MKYRVLAFLLVVLLTLPMIPTGNVYGATDSAESNAVQLLSILNIMEPDPKTGIFWDDTPVQRREMAEILCSMFQIKPTLDAKSRFEDVAQEDRACIETVVRLGYMSGYGLERFGPKDYITNAQMLKVFVSILDANGMADVMGGFPEGYIRAAQRLHLVDSLKFLPDDFARRIDVANVIYRALHTNIFSPAGVAGNDVLYVEKDGATFLTEVLDIYRYSGVVNQNDSTSLDSELTANEGEVKVGEHMFLDSRKLTDDYFGSNVIIYVKKPKNAVRGEIIFVEEHSDNSIVYVDSDDFAGVNGRNLNYYQGDRNRNLRLAAVVNTIYNGKAGNYEPSRLYLTNGSMQLIDNNGDDMYDVILLTEYQTFAVERVNVEDEKILLRFDELPIELKDTNYSIFRDGKRISLEEIAMGEIISVAISDNQQGEKTIRIEAATTNLLGGVASVREKKGDTYVTVGEKEYKIGDYCKKLITKGSLPLLKAGVSGQFYLDIKGNIACFNVSSGTEPIGYLVDFGTEKAAFSAKLSVKIYTIDKKLEVYTAAEKLRIGDKTVKVADIVENNDILNSFNNKELVYYSVGDGNVLKGIRFAERSYDGTRFSLDESRYMKCTCKSVLDDKYYVTQDTTVFFVPSVSVTDKNYSKYINESSYYNLYTGSYFGANIGYTVQLYDIDENNKVKYAVVTWNPNNTRIYEGTQMIAVTNVGHGMSADGDITRFIAGLDENGNEVEFVGVDDVSVYDSTLKREAKEGDVVQYWLDYAGRLKEVKIIHSVDESSYYTPVAIEPSRSNYTVTKVYGEVMRNSGSNIIVSCKPIWQDMTPLDADKLVGTTSKAVYRFSAEKEKFYPISVTEIERGERIFACVSNSNNTRMLVVYD